MDLSIAPSSYWLDSQMDYLFFNPITVGGPPGLHDLGLEYRDAEVSVAYCYYCRNRLLMVA